MKIRAGSAALILTSICLSAWADPPPPATKKTLQAFAQNALSQAFGELGLGATERKLFDAEVLTDPMTFVASYKTSGNGESEDIIIDRERLKNYLRFSSALFSAGQPGSDLPRVCVAVLPEPGCASCAVLRLGLSSRLSARFERRGYGVKGGPELADGYALKGERAFEDYAARGGEAGCDGVVFAELEPDRASDEDDESDVIKLRATTYFQLRSSRKIKSRGQSVATVSRELTSDAEKSQALTQLVSKATVDLFAGAAALGGARKGGADLLERYVRLDRVENFATYSQFKQSASALSGARLEERVISPGSFQFAIVGDASMSDLLKQLKELSWGERKMEVLNSSPDEIVMVLK